MAGQNTEVTTGKLRQAANNLSDLISRYNSAVDRFYIYGAEIDAMWEGDAGRKFMGALTNDRERFNALTKILQRYVDVLSQDANIYAKAEADVLSILGSNAIR